MRILKDTHIDFIKYSKTAVITSAIIILAGMISVFAIRGLNFGIDFSGGTLIQLKFENPVTSSDLRSDLAKVNLDKSVIQQLGGENEFLIRVAEHGGDINVQEQVESTLKQRNNPYEILKVEKVGPQIGAELRKSAVKAILWAIFWIGVYITFRFEFRFAMGAVVALIHDVLFTLGIFSFLQFEISVSTIAAFLTIVGYSLNDTIVLFDRVRENRKKNKRLDVTTLVNNSINQTISRTIITSLTTFIVVVVLAFSTGEIQIFAFTMIIGVIVGTYSSIFIAGPIVVEWEKRIQNKK
ncbi:MAG: protein translocase subunit SecF [Candidatus Marinimicrobia bacterium]|nr:protein translocase subunit SecF [Candidatus Neomarinimicrobiota bacterium]